MSILKKIVFNIQKLLANYKSSWVFITILNLTIVLFFFILSIKIFDLSLGFIGSSNNETFPTTKRSLLLKELSPNLNITLKPSNDYILETENLTQKDFLMRTNEDGFIVGPKDFINTKDKVRIIFFGGSTTECMYVEEDRRFPYLVSQKLNIRVLNGGVSGNQSMHSLLAMIGKGIPYKPDQIIYMHAVNDLGNLSKTLSYWNAPDGRALIQKEGKAANSTHFELARDIKNFLVPNLWLKTRHIFHGVVDSLAEDEWAKYRDKKHKFIDIEKALDEQFRASLKSFVRVSRAWDIEPILMTQFNRIKKDDKFIRSTYEKKSQPISFDEYVSLYQRTNEIVRLVAKEEKVFLIDLDVNIPSTNEYIYDAVHLNSKGSTLVAEEIAAALRKRYPSVYQ